MCRSLSLQRPFQGDDCRNRRGSSRR
jgi:hypothetical protein